VKHRFLTLLTACGALFLCAGRDFPALARADTPAPQAERSPAPGDVFPAFDTQAVDGSSQHVSFPKGSRTVLLFFLSSCSVCHKMIPEWNRAYQRRSPSLKVFGVLLDQEPPGFFTVTPVAFPVLRSPGRDFLQARKISRVPVTLRVAEGGKVEDVAVGIVDPIRLGEIFRP
jgi:hypothetical protein